MNQPISVFIMDISNSSEGDFGRELSNYLHELKNTIVHWTESLIITKATHRAGDELVVISEGFATAYILAFYISRIWKYPNHLPYFGLSFGVIEEELTDINIETWIHPLMKQARLANDFLKNETNRKQFRFELKNMDYSAEFMQLLNTNLMLQQELINEQTAIQSSVLSLYLILDQQNKVSEYLNRTNATISSHMKNGKTEVILYTFSAIINVLNTLENYSPTLLTDELQKKIKQYVNDQLYMY